jgi:O-antigen ligase
MPTDSYRESAGGGGRAAIVGVVIFAAIFASVARFAGPEILTMGLVGITGLLTVGVRPSIGLGVLLFMLLVQYGARPAFAGAPSGGFSVWNLVPQGTGLLSVNNVLGLLLLTIMIYHVRATRDWSFLKTRSVQLILAVTAVLVFSAFVSGITQADIASIGLVTTLGEDPSRIRISRALFVILFVFFVKNPRDLRGILFLFIILSVLTAWSGASAGAAGQGMAARAPGSVGYRAGGAQVLLESTANPNRLGMIATLALIYIWEYTETVRSNLFRLGALGVILLLVVTVFMTASRGGLIGLVFAGVMMFARRSGSSARILYGFVALAVGGGLIQEIVPQEALDRITAIPGLSSNTAETTNSLGQSSVEKREYTIGIGLQVWQESPIIGVGPGNWAYVRYLLDPLRSAGAAHNSFLEMLAEGGVIGLSIYLWIFYFVTYNVLRCEWNPEILARARSDGLEWVLVGTRICLLSFMVFSVFADLWDLIFSYFLIAVSTVLIQRYLEAPAESWAEEPALQPAWA